MNISIVLTHCILITLVLFVLVNYHSHAIIVNLDSSIVVGCKQPREGRMKCEALDAAALGFKFGYQGGITAEIWTVFQRTHGRSGHYSNCA